jgi:hypothetical protein
MTGSEPAGNRILGTLRTQDGKGVVTVRDRFDTDIDDLWSAIRPFSSGRSGACRCVC